MSVVQPLEIVEGRAIRVRGLVQGVGFRPTVWRLARDCNLAGEVYNDAEGVMIRAWGGAGALEHFTLRLRAEPPPLARVDAIESKPLDGHPSRMDFQISASHGGQVRTGVVADAATCAACLADIRDPANRRYRYPFTNCTHCGPRLTIVRTIPYDRAHTSMAAFTMCPLCRVEYEDPADRRFHAQPNACPMCGPSVRLVAVENVRAPELKATSEPVSSYSRHSSEGRNPVSDKHRASSIVGFQEQARPATDTDPIDVARQLIEAGAIVAIKGLGGFHLACDACNDGAVARLRARKRRYDKPFALMARDLDVIGHYCRLDAAEAALLESSRAPIVLLAADGTDRVAAAVAPQQRSLGFMLPYTPLHHLLLQRFERPMVLTSGNLSDEPQCIDNDEARRKLAGIADYILAHDRAIVNRVDDSLARVVDGKARLLRRARGYAPAPLPLPDGFEAAPPVLAFGGELKNTFCLLKDGRAIVSQHMGDLENAAAFADYRKNLGLYRELYAHRPDVLAVDLHPEYLSAKLGREHAERDGLALSEVQHHHAHIASCMAENGLALNARPVLGLALDGLGYGEDGAVWGGECLLADYRGYRRLARFKPVAMIGGARAIHEPWRNTYAHLRAAFGWEQICAHYTALGIIQSLRRRPLATLNAMIEQKINSPPASSCGRLFDAVAAAVGICSERASYEGQAAIELEALVDEALFEHEPGYRFSIVDADVGRVSPSDVTRRHALDHTQSGYAALTRPTRKADKIVTLDPTPMWRALLDDLAERVPASLIAARFHRGLADSLIEMVTQLAGIHDIDTAALSGGVFQNRILFEHVAAGLRDEGMMVLTHSALPANDGGLALGQAVVAAARAVKFRSTLTKDRLQH